MSRFSVSFAPLPKLALGAAAALAALSLSPGDAQAACALSSPANTCRVTVNSVEYDVSTFTGSNSNLVKFAPPPAPGAMPWWGSQSTASAFATAVGTGLGLVNNGTDGPIFAYDNYSGGGVKMVVFQSGSGSLYPVDGVDPTFPYYTWAQASVYSSPAAPAPAPLPLLGAGAAFGFSRKLRKRIKLAPSALGSSLPLA